MNAGCFSELSRDRKTLKILKKNAAIDDLIDRFNVPSTSPSPVAVNVKLRPIKDEDREAIDHVVGRLTWIATMTRLDIKTAVGEVARHWSAARQTLKYLNYTEGPIIRKGYVKDLLVVHADTYYAREEENRHPFMGDVHECRSECCLIFEDSDA